MPVKIKTLSSRISNQRTLIGLEPVSQTDLMKVIENRGVKLWDYLGAKAIPEDDATMIIASFFKCDTNKAEDIRDGNYFTAEDLPAAAAPKAPAVRDTFDYSEEDSPFLANVEIHANENGLLSLNDLHKAAGGLPKHKPANFLRTAIAQTEIEYLSDGLNCSNVSSLIISQSEGRSGGTFVCMELVYSYAAWISPKFKIDAMRTFQAFHEGRLAPAEPQQFQIPQTLSEALTLAGELAADNEKKSQLLIEQKPKVTAYEEWISNGDHMTPSEAAKHEALAVLLASPSAQALNAILLNNFEWFDKRIAAVGKRRRNRKYTPTTKAVSRGWLAMKSGGYLVTPKGLMEIARRLRLQRPDLLLN